MSRIKIKDLPKDQKISNEEMKRVLGGMTLSSQSILPQGEDLMKAGAEQFLPTSIALYGGSAFYGGRAIIIGGGLY